MSSEDTEVDHSQFQSKDAGQLNRRGQVRRTLLRNILALAGAGAASALLPGEAGAEPQPIPTKPPAKPAIGPDDFNYTFSKPAQDSPPPDVPDYAPKTTEGLRPPELNKIPPIIVDFNNPKSLDLKNPIQFNPDGVIKITPRDDQGYIGFNTYPTRFVTTEGQFEYDRRTLGVEAADAKFRQLTGQERERYLRTQVISEDSKNQPLVQGDSFQLRINDPLHPEDQSNVLTLQITRPVGH